MPKAQTLTPTQIDQLLYLIGGIGWLYIYAYIIDVEIRSWVEARTGITFITVRGKGFNPHNHYETHIKERVDLKKSIQVWALYGVIAIPVLILWVGIGLGVMKLVEKFILKM